MALTKDDRDELVMRIQTARDACLDALEILDDGEVSGSVYNAVEGAFESLFAIEDAAAKLEISADEESEEPDAA